MAGQKILNVVLGLAVLSSILTATITVRREFSVTGNRSENSADVPVVVKDWERHIPSGRLLGSPNAALTVVEFADFQCPACRSLHSLLKRVSAQFPSGLAISYHYVPLPYHARAYDAARAAECAADQGRFEVMHDLLFANFSSLDTLAFSRLALEAQVPDLEKFARCASSTARVARIERDRALGLDTLKIGGTPTMLVNGKMYRFAPRLDELKKMIGDAQTHRHREP